MVQVSKHHVYRTVQKLTACVEVPVVDYIKLDLQLKDVSLNGCADIFNLENSDAAAVGKPKFDTRTGDSLYSCTSIKY